MVGEEGGGGGGGGEDENVRSEVADSTGNVRYMSFVESPITYYFPKRDPDETICEKITRLNILPNHFYAGLERRAAALRQLKNYLRSTMKQDRLNNCLLMHIVKKLITDTLDTVKIAKRFACANKLRKGHFWEI